MRVKKFFKHVYGLYKMATKSWNIQKIGKISFFYILISYQNYEYKEGISSQS